jgi:hypothetical protein
MTTITTTAVNPSDLIESSWGNAVRTDLINLNADKAELAGATFTGDVNGITPTSAAHLTRKDYVDGVVAGLLSASGGTVTGGSITIATSGQGVNLPAGEPSSAARAARKDYVDTQVATRLATTGGNVSGSITITASGQGINLPTGEPSSAARAARKDYVDAAVANTVSTTGDTMTGLLSATAGVNVPAPADASKATNKAYVDALVAARLPTSGGTVTGFLAVNDTDISGVTSGGAIYLANNGAIQGAVEDINVHSLYLKRYGGLGAANVGQRYVTFRRTTANTEIGHISIASTSSVSYNTTSDPRLKVRHMAIGDALDRVRRLGRAAFRGHWKDDPNLDEWDFVSSHDVEDVAPYAVTGERDAVDADGEIEAQMVDFAKLVPLLAASVADLADLIEGITT